MLGAKDKDHLDHAGWVLLGDFVGEDAEAALLGLASYLGVPAPSRPSCGLVDKLQPIVPSSARRSSLSRHHGTGAFPFHTDTAHWQVPARYMVLGCIDPGRKQRATLLCGFSALMMSEPDMKLLEGGVFVVRNGSRSWHSTVLGGGRSFVRFDPGCMAPANERGREAESLLAGRLAAARPHRIEWETGCALVVDNWKVLHGREAADGDDDRVLLRVLATNNG